TVEARPTLRPATVPAARCPCPSAPHRPAPRPRTPPRTAWQVWAVTCWMPSLRVRPPPTSHLHLQSRPRCTHTHTRPTTHHRQHHTPPHTHTQLHMTSIRMEWDSDLIIDSLLLIKTCRAHPHPLPLSFLLFFPSPLSLSLSLAPSFSLSLSFPPSLSFSLSLSL